MDSFLRFDLVPTSESSGIIGPSLRHCRPSHPGCNVVVFPTFVSIMLLVPLDTVLVGAFTVSNFLAVVAVIKFEDVVVIFVRYDIPTQWSVKTRAFVLNSLSCRLLHCVPFTEQSDISLRFIILFSLYSKTFSGLKIEAMNTDLDHINRYPPYFARFA